MTPLLPRRGDVPGKLKGVDARVVGLQVAPEQLAEHVGQVLQRGEVAGQLALAQVVDQQVTHRSAGDVVAVDQLGAGRLASAGEHPQRRRRVIAEAAQVAQELVEQRVVRAAVQLGADLVGDLV